MASAILLSRACLESSLRILEWGNTSTGVKEEGYCARMVCEEEGRRRGGVCNAGKR